MAIKPPKIGGPAPWFQVRSSSNPRYCIDTVAGRIIVLCFYASMANPASAETMERFYKQRETFDDKNCIFFGVSVDEKDEKQGRIKPFIPGFRLLWDFDRKVSGLYGLPGVDSNGPYPPHTFVLDERLRVVACIPFSEDADQHVASVLDVIASLPPKNQEYVSDIPAPVLVVPRIFEPELCQTLMTYYNEFGGENSGFMKEIDGKTVGASDHGFKRRRDQLINDEDLRKECMYRIHNRLLPEIHKAFNFQATRIERYIVARYDGETGGHFSAHRDNTTPGTAHRRFAVSLNLNAEEYEGGMLRFPEYGRQVYSPPTGGAVVFSCSLLHEATPVTAGTRYAFLPFLYDAAAADVRQKNREREAAEEAEG